MKRLILSILITFNLNSMAQHELSFEEIWKQILNQSQELKSKNLSVESKNESLLAKQAHWYPKLYLKGQAKNSNNPSVSFFSHLNQSQVVQEDFSIDNINSNTFETNYNLGLQLELELYAGSAQIYKVESAKEQKNASLNSAYQKQNELYSNLISIGILIRNETDTINLLNNYLSEVRAILSSYKIGKKSNPIGYSGLLGLRGYSQRLEAELIVSKNKISMWKSKINTMANNSLPNEWTWNPKKDLKFQELKFEGENFFTKSMEHQINSALSETKAYSANFKPHLIAAVSADNFSGTRGDSNTTTALLALQWNLLPIAQTKEYKSHALNAETMISQLQYSKMELSNQYKLLVNQTAEWKKLNDLLLNNLLILDEQVELNVQLFKNGSINALQLIEVLSKRVDLLKQKTEINMQIVNNESQIYQISSNKESNHEYAK